ncbi:hypothetical protein AAG570_009825 [Ranatra chinensis]|uniref:Uncharacterized protein n=1 Tax=Ranatra chinensis TaxID=642074 RepID=A0ABD0Z7B0_9HEMI
MASKSRNMFYENKKQETTEIETHPVGDDPPHGLRSSGVRSVEIYLPAKQILADYPEMRFTWTPVLWYDGLAPVVRSFRRIAQGRQRKGRTGVLSGLEDIRAERQERSQGHCLSHYGMMHHNTAASLMTELSNNQAPQMMNNS